MAISVAVAVDDAADLLVKKIEERAVAIKVSNGTEPGAEMGPVISPESREFICKTVAAAEAAGAAMVMDGRNIIVPGHEKGFWVGPTVIDHVKTGMSAYTEEIFGPVVVVVRVDDLDAGIALINANPYGNGTAIFTSSGSDTRTFQRSVDVGMIGINVPLPVPVAYHSFGAGRHPSSVTRTFTAPRACRSSPVARSSRPAGRSLPTRQELRTTSPPTRHEHVPGPAQEAAPGPASIITPD